MKLKLQAYESSSKSDNFDREKFYEGASWMGQQAVAEADRVVKAVEHVRGEYRKKVGESGDDKFKRESISEWVIDSCDRIAKETRD